MVLLDSWMKCIWVPISDIWNVKIALMLICYTLTLVFYLDWVCEYWINVRNFWDHVEKETCWNEQINVKSWNLK